MIQIDGSGVRASVKNPESVFRLKPKKLKIQWGLKIDNWSMVVSLTFIIHEVLLADSVPEIPCVGVITALRNVAKFKLFPISTYLQNVSPTNALF